MKIAVIIQARIGSSRFPGKVLEPILNIDKPNPVCSLELIYNSTMRSGVVDQVIVACPEKDFDVFQKWAATQKEYSGKRIDVFPGMEEDVFQRVLRCAETFGVDVIVDITGDCPLVPAYEVRRLVLEYQRRGLLYASNVFPVRVVPDGWDVQVYSTVAMRHLFTTKNVKCKQHSGWNFFAVMRDELPDCSVADFARAAWMRLTLDTPEDLAVIRKVAADFANGGYLLNHKKAQQFTRELQGKPTEWWDNRKIIAKEAGRG